MTLHIENQTVNITIAPASGIAPIGAALLRAFMPVTGDESVDELAATAQAPTDRPAIGEYWPGQGGIYAGDFLGGNGIYGLIVATPQDVGSARWAPSGQRDLSDWDGLANTQALHNDCPAAKLAVEYTQDEHTDFYLPARREMLLAAANLHDTFGKESWYWSSTPYSNDYAWAVDFEYGRCRDYHRSHDFRVRPVRRFFY